MVHLLYNKVQESHGKGSEEKLKPFYRVLPKKQRQAESGAFAAWELLQAGDFGEQVPTSIPLNACKPPHTQQYTP